MRTFYETASVEAATEKEEIAIKVLIRFTSKTGDVTRLQEQTIKELKRNIEQFLLDQMNVI
ncbi:hypothetical protein [Sphingobacterium thalpophilum]|uniref:hypothetical protein n=1 Tax=Sphingobacterium thalpophilum TaxID=259 RepID=UPI003D997769